MERQKYNLICTLNYPHKYSMEIHNNRTLISVILFFLGFTSTNTVMVISQNYSFTDEGRPQVLLCASFQTQTGT
jgi:hypothetical protein